MLITRAAATVLSSGVIFPLYIYPGSGCTGWTAVNTAITAHTDLPFYIVVNPASGPGGAGTQPDSNYQACVADLKTTSNPNVKVLGYVATGQGSRASSAVTADVDTYAGWTASYRPDGIFFDEAATSANLLSTYETYTTRVQDDLGDNSFIVLNPGTTPDSSYFGIANLIVTAENYYDDFDVSQLTFSSTTPASKQAVILHDGPSTTPVALVDELVGDGIGAIFITDFANDVAYENIPSDWVNFVDDVEAAQ